MTESEGGSEQEGSGAGGSRGHLDSAEGGHGCTCRSLSSSATRAALKWAARAVPCCQERAAAGQAGTWEGRVGDGQILTSAECMREQCAWACNAVERGHCQNTQGTGARDPLRRHRVSSSPSRFNHSPGPLSTYSHGSPPCTCPEQLSPRTLSGSPCVTWLPSEHSAGQSSSVGWGRTWGESEAELIQQYPGCVCSWWTGL